VLLRYEPAVYAQTSLLQSRSPVRNTRVLLPEAGIRTFSKAGFNGCSVQDITEAAGVPRG
jgi:AcrR family transcriptional regulator